MDTRTVIFIVTAFVVLWTLYAFFRFIPESAAGKKFFYKFSQVFSYGVFAVLFGYVVLATEVREEDFFKFEWKFILSIFAVCTFLMGLRWLIEIFKVKLKEQN